MLRTQTGSFPIGFRRGWSDWQKDLPALVQWAKANQLGVLDLGSDAGEVGKTVLDAGLKLGSVDLKDWRAVIGPDTGKREAALHANAELIEKCAAMGVVAYFCVLLPEDPEAPRAENFKLAVEGLKELAPVLEKHGGHLVIEGWPGPGALACTPEGVRALFKEIDSSAIGLNYDPSHLIRMGINPLKFAEEFGERVFHCHGKDTEVMNEGFYEYGIEQPPTFFQGHGFGGSFWRYTIPGHGQMRWTRAFEILASKGYKGAVCIELEDERFNGTTEGEQAGLIAGGRYLASC